MGAENRVDLEVQQRVLPTAEPHLCRPLEPPLFSFNFFFLVMGTESRAPHLLVRPQIKIIFD